MSGKKNKKQRKEQQVQVDSKNEVLEEQSEFSPKVEKLFKLILRTMSWIIGIAFVATLVLPEFNQPVLDKITKVLFLIGLITLILFIVIEFLGKRFLSNLLHE